MRRAYALTFATEVLVALSSLLVFRIAASYWNPEVFGEYVLARRTLTLLYGATALGLLTSVPRYIAQVRADPTTTHYAGAYLLSGLILLGASVSLVGVIFLVAPGPTASALFGSAAYQRLLPPLYLCLIGVTLHSLAYSYFRGHLKMRAANLLQFLDLGLLNVVPFALPHLSPVRVFATLGIAMVLIAGSTMAVVARREITPTIDRAELWRRGRELLRYGGPRIPGEFALAALLTLPATLAAHFGGIQQAGYVGLSVSALSLAGSFFAPIGLVLLPDATTMLVRGERTRLTRGLTQLVLVAAALTTAGVLVLELIADPLVRWYLGPQYGAAAGILRLTMLGAVPYVLYILLRSALDALTIRALNARNLLIGLLAFGVLVMLMPSVQGVAIALSVALALTGALTAIDAWSLLHAPKEPPLGGQAM